MADPVPASKSTVKDGKLITTDGTIKEKFFPKIEKGAMSTVHAIVVHQTGGSTADSAFGSYKNGKAAAHFLIDKDGTVYQTARVDRMCWHVGKIQSRCYSLKTCSTDELKDHYCPVKSRRAIRVYVEALSDSGRFRAITP